MRISFEIDTNTDDPKAIKALKALIDVLASPTPEPGLQICRPGEETDTVTIWAPDGKHKLAEGSMSAMDHVKHFEHMSTDAKPEEPKPEEPKPEGPKPEEPKKEKTKPEEPKSEKPKKEKAEKAPSEPGNDAKANGKRIRELLLEAAGLPNTTVDDAKAHIFSAFDIKALKDIQPEDSGKVVESLSKFVDSRRGAE